jgi:recombinational DNA repair protein (RecF pathway)
MSYHVYTTRALVLSYTSTKEADRLYNILTRDLGVIRASARAVRKEMSKLRGALEPYSILNISLIKGRGEWKITSGSLEYSIKNLGKDFFLAFVRALTLLEKLVAGESKHPEILDTIDNFVNLSKTLRKEDTEAMEILLVASVLNHLGYVSIHGFEPKLFSDIDADSINLVKENKSKLVKAINDGITASGLI